MKKHDIVFYIVFTLIVVGIVGLGVYAKYENEKKDKQDNTVQKQEKKETKKVKKKEKENNKKTETKEDETVNKNTDDTETDNTKTVNENTTYDHHFPEFNKISIQPVGSSVTIKINSKDITISVEYKKLADDGPASIIVKINDVELAGSLYIGAPYIYYRTIKGNDNKEYLIVGNWYYGEEYVIYDDNLNEIHRIESLVNDELHCFILFKDRNLLSIEDGTIYFYQYVKGSKEASSSKVKARKIKLTINDGVATEEETDTIIDGIYGNCIT